MEQTNRTLRQTAGKQRLKIALDLHELSFDVARARIRHQNPNADEAGVERLLHKRIRLANSEKQASEITIAKRSELPVRLAPARPPVD